MDSLIVLVPLERLDVVEMSFSKNLRRLVTRKVFLPHLLVIHFSPLLSSSDFSNNTALILHDCSLIDT